MTELETVGMHHVALVAAEAARTTGFYGDLLGLALVARADDGTLYFGGAGGGPGTLLKVSIRPAAVRGRWGVGGVHHVALGTSGEDELLRWKRRLTDAGVRVTGPYDRGYFTSLYFPDPDGQIVEIATAGPGYLIDESPEALGRALKMPPERLLRGHRDEASIAALTWPEPVPEITPEMELTGIHHVSGLTDDLELALDWYPAALGLQVIKRTLNRDDGRTHHYFWGAREGNGVAPHSSWTLFGWPGSDYRWRAGVGQVARVAFRATDAEQQASWRDHLLRLDVDVSEPVDVGPFRTMTFEAPDGQRLAITTDGPGFQARAPVVARSAAERSHGR